MEHRCNRRQPLTGDVVLYHGEQPFPLCKVRNVSSGGMLLEMPMGIIPRGVLVDLIHNVPGEGRQRLRAQVIHRTGRYVGLMFLSDNAGASIMNVAAVA
jgi:hypothetical protein